MQTVNAIDPLTHPNCTMGAKITIDSASMINKVFEVIAAKWLFDVKPEQIEVVVHPQSIIHSMVQFSDGAIKAQLGVPDMKVPIAYAMSYPYRMPSNINPKLTLADYANLTFEAPDYSRFPNLKFAFDSMLAGGNTACVLNAANEVVVDAFLKNKCGFLQMSQIIEKALEKIAYIQVPTYEDYVETDRETRLFTKSLL